MLVLVAVLLIPFAAIWNGYALSVLWGWFVVPVFGLPALAIAPAIGVAMVVGYLTHHTSSAQQYTGNEGLVAAIITAVLRPALVLAFGWIVHLFM